MFPPTTIIDLGQTEQSPFRMKLFSSKLQGVQTLPELIAYPGLQTHFPFERSSFCPQLEQLEPSAVA